MNYEQRLANVTVLGAAGKMGSGILLLTAMEMADLKLKPENADKVFVLNAMDVSDKGLEGLMGYLRVQITKAAEKKTIALRAMYADRKDLVENSDIINQYVFDVISLVRPTTRIESAFDSTLVFEAIKEDPDLKISIFKRINENNSKAPWFFTNTSSIPITNLDQKTGLGGRVVGFHFYNPPAIQKLVELIKADNTTSEVEEFAMEYAKKLRKIIVPSNDFAGFIGNGHFMRDGLYGITEAEKLAEGMPLTEAIYMVNKVSQDLLVRPMGIFQLIDYVGVDVVSYIMSVMNPHLPDENLHHSLLDKMVAQEVTGGQNSDGSQKDGFLKYHKGQPVAVYDIEKKSYTEIGTFKAKCVERLGAPPASLKPWKAVIGDRKKEQYLEGCFNDLKNTNTLGAQMAVKYGGRSKEIGELLVNSNVANSEEDVNTVLMTGFFHAYGPINNFF